MFMLLTLSKMKFDGNKLIIIAVSQPQMSSTHVRLSVCVCVCMRARASMRASVWIRYIKNNG